MKKPILLLVLFLAFACSKEDDCSDKVAEIDTLYKSILSNDGITAEQRREITAQYKSELETPCDFR